MLNKILFLGIFASYSSLSLFACNNQAISLDCQAKLLDAHALRSTRISIPIKDNQRLVYSKKRLSHFKKYDPFLNLYLISTQQKFKYPFIFTNAKAPLLIVNSIDSVEKISYKKAQIGLKHLAQVDKPLTLPSVISDNCCALEGLVTDTGIIQKSYLQHFIHTKNPLYADIGIRLEEKNHNVTVSAVDPFFKNTPFKVGDIIVKIDNHLIHSAAKAMQIILFSKLHQKLKIAFLRHKKLLTKVVTTQKRLGGGTFSDTFLEHLGFYFDENFALLQDIQKYHLKKGDRLLQLNGVKIHSQQDIIDAFTPTKKNKLLIKRGNFTFYSAIAALNRNYSKNDVRIFNKW